jgi:hypothetical protein
MQRPVRRSTETHSLADRSCVTPDGAPLHVGALPLPERTHAVSDASVVVVAHVVVAGRSGFLVRWVRVRGVMGVVVLGCGIGGAAHHGQHGDPAGAHESSDRYRRKNEEAMLSPVV